MRLPTCRLYSLRRTTELATLLVSEKCRLVPQPALLFRRAPERHTEECCAPPGADPIRKFPRPSNDPDSARAPHRRRFVFRALTITLRQRELVCRGEPGRNPALLGLCLENAIVMGSSELIGTPAVCPILRFVGPNSRRPLRCRRARGF